MDGIDSLVQELRAKARASNGAQPDAGSDRPPRAQRSMRRTLTRRQWLAAIGTVLVLLVFGSLAAMRGQRDVTRLASPSRTTPADTATDTATDSTFATAPTPLQWKAVIEQLDRRRGMAFMHGEPLEVFSFDALASPALATDEAMLSTLAAKKARADSFPLRVLSVTERYLTMGERRPRAMLRVVDVMGAYKLVGKHGEVLRSIAARGQRQWDVELERSSLWGWVYVSALSATST